MKKKYVLLFILVIAVFLSAFGWMISSFGVAGNQVGFTTMFLMNLPWCVLLGATDLLIVNISYKKLGIRHISARIAVDLAITALAAVLMTVVANYIIIGSSLSEYNALRTYLPMILWNSTIVLFIEIFLSTQRQAEAERKLADAEKEKIRYQYEMLKAQINPHFLFNSLNVLSSLAYQDAEKTNLFVKKLSSVYRYLLLTNERPTVTLREELSFLESYIFLEHIRFGDALSIEIGDAEKFLDKMVIPVSLQLLVENALKHNITTSQNPLAVRLEIDSCGITVTNSLQLRNTVDKNGMGLDNLRKQYALHGKEIEISQSDTEFTVSVPFI
mgnify:CR=1 FL=1